MLQNIRRLDFERIRVKSRKASWKSLGSSHDDLSRGSANSTSKLEASVAKTVNIDAAGEHNPCSDRCGSFFKVENRAIIKDRGLISRQARNIPSSGLFSDTDWKGDILKRQSKDDEASATFCRTSLPNSLQGTPWCNHSLCITKFSLRMH